MGDRDINDPSASHGGQNSRLKATPFEPVRSVLTHEFRSGMPGAVPEPRASSLPGPPRVSVGGGGGIREGPLIQPPPTLISNTGSFAAAQPSSATANPTTMPTPSSSASSTAPSTTATSGPAATPKKSGTSPYMDEETAFNRTLREFYNMRYKTPPLAKVNGIQANLYQLYLEVTKLGGLRAVLRDGKMPQIVRAVPLSQPVPNPGFTLRSIYSRCLLAYEIYHNGMRPLLSQYNHSLDDTLYFTPAPKSNAAPHPSASEGKSADAAAPNMAELKAETSLDPTAETSSGDHSGAVSVSLEKQRLRMEKKRADLAARPLVQAKRYAKTPIPRVPVRHLLETRSDHQQLRNVELALTAPSDEMNEWAVDVLLLLSSSEDGLALMSLDNAEVLIDGLVAYCGAFHGPERRVYRVLTVLRNLLFHPENGTVLLHNAAVEQGLVELLSHPSRRVVLDALECVLHAMSVRPVAEALVPSLVLGAVHLVEWFGSDADMSPLLLRLLEYALVVPADGILQLDKRLLVQLVASEPRLLGLLDNTLARLHGRMTPAGLSALAILDALVSNSAAAKLAVLQRPTVLNALAAALVSEHVLLASGTAVEAGDDASELLCNYRQKVGLLLMALSEHPQATAHLHPILCLLSDNMHLFMQSAALAKIFQSVFSRLSSQEYVPSSESETAFSLSASVTST